MNHTLNIYYPLPKMNPKNISHIVPIYSVENAQTIIPPSSFHFFLKDIQERHHAIPPPFSSKKYYFQSLKKKETKTIPLLSSIHSTSPPAPMSVLEIEKEWSKLCPLLIQLHVFHTPLTFLSHFPVHDSSWNYMHYFPLQSYSQHTHSYSKYSIPPVGLFLLPHSFYFSNLQNADLILSLYELQDEYLVYLTLFALLVQNPKGSFVMKLKFFYTPLMMDILYLLSCCYNKVILLPLDYVNFYVVCKGFQMDYVKPHFTQMKHILYSLRDTAVQRIVVKDAPFKRLFSKPLPALFISKMEEIHVLIQHKHMMNMNERKDS